MCMSPFLTYQTNVKIWKKRQSTTLACHFFPEEIYYSSTGNKKNFYTED